MNAYIFRCNSSKLGLKVTLAEILANSLEEAYVVLPIQHEWCGANKNNCTLVRAVSIEPPLMFDALLPSY